MGHHSLPASFMCMDTNATHHSQFNFLLPQQIKAVFHFTFNSLINRQLDIYIYALCIRYAISTASDCSLRGLWDCCKQETTGGNCLVKEHTDFKPLKEEDCQTWQTFIYPGTEQGLDFPEAVLPETLSKSDPAIH